MEFVLLCNTMYYYVIFFNYIDPWNTIIIRPQHEALGNNYRVYGVYWPEPCVMCNVASERTNIHVPFTLLCLCFACAEVYCFRPNFNVSKLGYSYLQCIRKKKSLHTSQVAHQALTYPSFRSMKWLGVFLLRPGWDASPSQGYCGSKVSCPRTQHNVRGQGSNPDSSPRNQAHILTAYRPYP